LNFLVQTDKMWNRQRMLERARQVFLSVYLARESGNPDQVPAKDLFPEVAQSLQEQIRAWQASGVTVEYRNICVRKVDLILVRNYAGKAADEYCVRIYAHAQKITRKNGNVVSQQQYATPFEEYWTLGRLDEEWKLKEVLPSGRVRKIVGEENVNEESSAGELQWYYRQTRAR
jgi:predicted lipid-binding transport protein (Tim44 family)